MRRGGLPVRKGIRRKHDMKDPSSKPGLAVTRAGGLAIPAGDKHSSGAVSDI